MISKRIWTIADSGEGFAILDATKAAGCDWCVGGCAIFAFALREYFGEGDVVVVYNNRLKRVEHFGLMRLGWIIDGAGIYGNEDAWVGSLEQDAISKFNVDDMVVFNYDPGLNVDDIVIDMEASRGLAELMENGV